MTDFKPKPVIVLDLEYNEIVAHFILCNDEECFDCVMKEGKETTLRYLRLPKAIEDAIMKISNPVERLYKFKYILQYYIDKKTSYKSKFLFWKLNPMHKRLKYF